MTKSGERRSNTRFLIVSVLLGAVLGATGCTTLPRNPVPVDHLESAEIIGMPDHARALGLAPSAPMKRDFAQAMVDGGREQGCDTRNGNPVFCVLIISGGGGYGAYGAGLMNGWTASGTRPAFKIVTGISTGSLIAPFAFLGPDWDVKLKNVFTTINGDADIVEERSLFGVLTSDSLTDTAPFRAAIARWVDENMLADVAREHQSGRRLYVGTTNMDAQRFTVWNMGAIASSGHPKALETFRKVLLASASVPIVMPPVFFDVEVNGEVYDEMHADGGVQSQFFVPLDVVDLPAAIAEAQANGFPYTPSPRMFVIRNAKFTPEPLAVDRNIVDIAARTVSSMIQAMGRSDLYQIFAIARVRGSDFHYTEVPPDFIWGADQEFDRAEMNRLYNIGYERGLTDSAWSDVPPGLFAKNTAAVALP